MSSFRSLLAARANVADVDVFPEHTATAGWMALFGELGELPGFVFHNLFWTKRVWESSSLPWLKILHSGTFKNFALGLRNDKLPGFDACINAVCVEIQPMVFGGVN